MELTFFTLERFAMLSSHPSLSHSTAQRFLLWSVTSWFAVAAVGLLLFAYYIAVFYGGSALRGDLQAWAKVMPKGWLPDQHTSNALLSSHLLFAFVVSVCGVLQLIPAVRIRAPGVHRVMGRVFLLAAVVATLTGFYLMIVKGTVGSTLQQSGTAINGALILVFAWFAFTNARARNISAHRRWALRLFLLVGGVWFFRVGLMLWLLLHQKPVGFDPNTFQGPTLTTLAFAQWIIPLTLLETYFLARGSSQASTKVLAAALLFVAALATAGGVFGAFMGLWRPHL